MTESETLKYHAFLLQDFTARVFADVYRQKVNPPLSVCFFQADPVTAWTKSSDHIWAQSLYDEEPKSSDVSQIQLFGLSRYELVQDECAVHSESLVSTGGKSTKHSDLK